MKDLLLKGLGTAQQLNAVYADIRWVERRSESLMVENGATQAVQESTDAGVGIRVLYDGAWGFAATGQVDDTQVQKIAARAVKFAQAASLISKRQVELAPAPVVNGSYHTAVETDPFEVPLEEKLALLQQATAEKAADDIKLTQAEMHFFQESTVFANTEGRFYSQEFLHSGAA